MTPSQSLLVLAARRGFAMTLALVLSLNVNRAAAQDDLPQKPDTPEVKTRPVKIGEPRDGEADRSITLTVPETWKQTELPSQSLRLAQFEIPPARDGEDRDNNDQVPVELAIFSFGGGGNVQQNIDRWISQFEPQGREAKTTVGEATLGKYVFVDIRGTYKRSIGPPIRQQTEPLPDARMLAAILAVKDKGVYYLKLAGPEKTVTANAGHFRRSFGGDAEKEKELKTVDESETQDKQTP